jgi:hypothetical protein
LRNLSASGRADSSRAGRHKSSKVTVTDPEDDGIPALVAKWGGGSWCSERFC